jgi:hypothetical protein
VVTDSTSTPRPCVAIELNDQFGADETWRDQLAVQLRAGLAGLNLDYKAALTEFPATMFPIVQTFARGDGPFRQDAGRIKQRRIIR